MSDMNDSFAKSIADVNSDVAAVKGNLSKLETDTKSDTNNIKQDLADAKQKITDADNNVLAVKSTATEAYTIASNASGNAVEAKTTASQAQTIATNAQNDVVAVKTTASQASVIASDAKSNAVAAVVSASEAKTIAQDAKGNAATAMQTANGFRNIVTSAQSQASAAQATATNAQNVANDAKNAASQAGSNATEALQNANEFKQIATNAQSDATVAKQTATEASTTVKSFDGKISNLTQTVDGLQASVKDKASLAQFNMLSGQLTAKVSTKDYESEIALLENNLNLRIKQGDLLSQINLEAGGNGLIQVANGKGKLYLDADSTVFSGKAFIPGAYITDIQADKITSGTLDAGNMRVINLTADNIHGGTLDVGDMHVKNFSANDIVAGTLTGIDILSKGENGKKYEMVGSQLKWSDDNKHYASIGQNDFHNNYVVNPAAFSLLSNSSIFLGRVPFDDKGEPKTSFLGLDNSSIWINDKGTQIASDGFHVLSVGEDQRYYDITKGEEWNTASFEIDTIGAIQFNLNPASKSLDAGTGKQSIDWNSNSQLNIQKDNHFGAYFGQGNNGNQINFAFGGDGCGFNVNGPLHVTGSKNSIVETRQGYLAINAYETAEYYFGDIGENNTGDTSQVVIGIDRIFNEVVNTDIQYQVFVTPYSNAHVWVEKRYNNRFIVKSDRPNAEFGWELKAKRKGYESNRLRRVNVDFNQMDLKGEN
ncbi:gp58-like family protein [Limosilactobacillus vaginalis]|uniref:gp58-like family protein n=1 Tax=Limosilactobacillus vaginalis TaxID=1633 RepID=UPI0037355884